MLNFPYMSDAAHSSPPTLSCTQRPLSRPRSPASACVRVRVRRLPLAACRLPPAAVAAEARGSRHAFVECMCPSSQAPCSNSAMPSQLAQLSLHHTCTMHPARVACLAWHARSIAQSLKCSCISGNAATQHRIKVLAIGQSQSQSQTPDPSPQTSVPPSPCTRAPALRLRACLT